MAQGPGSGGTWQLSMGALPYEEARRALALSALSMPDRIAFMQVGAPGDPGTPSNPRPIIERVRGPARGKLVQHSNTFRPWVGRGHATAREWTARR